MTLHSSFNNKSFPLSPSTSAIQLNMSRRISQVFPDTTEKITSATPFDESDTSTSKPTRLPLHRRIFSIQVIVLVAFLCCVAATGISIWGIQQGRDIICLHMDTQ
jgi:hypothetical protein